MKLYGILRLVHFDITYFGAYETSTIAEVTQKISANMFDHLAFQNQKINNEWAFPNIDIYVIILQVNRNYNRTGELQSGLYKLSSRSGSLALYRSTNICL